MFLVTQRIRYTKIGYLNTCAYFKPIDLHRRLDQLTLLIKHIISFHVMPHSSSSTNPYPKSHPSVAGDKGAYPASRASWDTSLTATFTASQDFDPCECRYYPWSLEEWKKNVDCGEFFYLVNWYPWSWSKVALYSSRSPTYFKRHSLLHVHNAYYNTSICQVYTSDHNIALSNMSLWPSWAEFSHPHIIQRYLIYN